MLQLNLGQRKTAMIVRQVRFARRSFKQSSVRISKFFREVMQDQSKIIFHVTFHIDGDLNNSRK